MNYPINHFKHEWMDENWLTQEEIDQFGRYGYYSKPFKFNKKAKIIAINTNGCNDLNWVFLSDLNRIDPG
jgi:hypothetical protein